MDALAKLKAFDPGDATLSLWVFKSHVAVGATSCAARWVETTEQLDAALKGAIKQRITAIGETVDYEALADNNEASALTIGLDETAAHLIVAATGSILPAHRVGSLRALQNIKFYAVKLVTADQKALYAVKRTDDSFKSRKAFDLVSVVFSGDRLDLETNPAFTLSKNFDFFIFEDGIFITHKAHFETVLSYRAAHIAAFSQLQDEPKFKALFSDLGPITEFVSSNKLQLRRAMAISQKGHYKDETFMARLREHCEALKLSIHFDEAGRIIPTSETCRDIFHALLDHRLHSMLSQVMYDVPSAQAVA